MSHEPFSLTCGSGRPGPSPSLVLSAAGGENSLIPSGFRTFCIYIVHHQRSPECRPLRCHEIRHTRCVPSTHSLPRSTGPSHVLGRNLKDPARRDRSSRAPQHMLRLWILPHLLPHLRPPITPSLSHRRLQAHHGPVKCQPGRCAISSSGS